jgi:hypothetical protein
MAYFHAIIKVSPPVRTRIKKFAQILGMCFSNVILFLFWDPSFLMLFFIHCSAFQFHFASFFSMPMMIYVFGQTYTILFLLKMNDDLELC